MPCPVVRPARILSGLAVLFLCLRLPAAGALTDDIFQRTNLLRLSIDIPEEGQQALRAAHSTRHSVRKPEAQATVSEGGRVYTNVTVQLKGYTTFQNLDGRPSLTLDFNKRAPGQKFHGLTKISLNNSLQDATRLNEKLGRELFAAAGVPVPRADYALLTLDGHELGLYVLVEGYDKTFLKRHFPRADGELYEGGTLMDITRPLHLLTGQDHGGEDVVARLVQAARQKNPELRWRELNAVLDMDRFLSMMAMETILCHSDSYSMNRNNYRLYHDPATGKVIFLPHGMDRVLGMHRSSLDLPIVPPSLGLIARAVLSTPQGRQAQIDRVGLLFTNHFDLDQLCRRVREMDARITEWKVNERADENFDRRPADSAAHDADNLCQRLSERAGHVRFQLAHAPELLTAAPAPEFDTNGVAHLAGWQLVPTATRPEPACEISLQDEIVHLHSKQGPLAVSLRCRVTLPVGHYRLKGLVQVTNAAGRLVRPGLTMLRYASERFGLNRQTLRASDINFSLEVREARAPEEIELYCEINDDSSDARFDARSLTLMESENRRPPP